MTSEFQAPDGRTFRMIRNDREFRQYGEGPHQKVTIIKGTPVYSIDDKDVTEDDFNRLLEEAMRRRDD